MHPQFTVDEARGYLAAMIDGEGWIGEPKGVWNRAIRIANTDPTLIAAICEACDVLGVTYTIQAIKPRKANWSAAQVVDITGRTNYRLVQRLVPIRSVKKIARLTRTLATYTAPELPDPDAIRSAYAAGLTRMQVAQQLGIGFKQVVLAFARHGIPAHPPAERRQLAWRARRERYGPTGRRPLPHTGVDF